MSRRAELKRIDSLKEYEHNARTHSDQQIEQIAGSIGEFGLVGAIVIRQGVIAKGHGTLAAVRKIEKFGGRVYPAPGKSRGAKAYPAGMVPVIDASGWTDEQFKAYVLADNQLALNAGWDQELRAVEIGDLQAADFDVGVLAIPDKELAKLLGDQPQNTSREVNANRHLLLLEFADEPSLKAIYEEMQRRGVDCKLMD